MTVLYTTHYMEEAERLCDRIGIVDLGELKAEGTRGELVALVGQHDRVQLQGRGDLEAGASACGALEAVRRRERARRRARADRRPRARLACGAASDGLGGRRRGDAVEVDEPDLEAVFLHLTGRAAGTR